MKDKKEYKMPELSETPSLREPQVSYLPKADDDKRVQFISDKELMENCMTLQESKRLIFERIYRDFHK